MSTDLYGTANLTLLSTGGIGAPVDGLWTVRQLAVDSANRLWLCTATGTPGTWELQGSTGASLWGQAGTAKYAGLGSPVGVVTPSGIGDLYIDNTTPALWQANGVANTDWQQQERGSGPILNRTQDITIPDGCSVVAVDYFSGSATLQGDAVLAII